MRPSSEASRVYDRWLTTEPDDEPRKERFVSDEPCETCMPASGTSFAALRWDPINKRAVPDTVGKRVFAEDFIA